jgi:hypothetical protein
MEQGRWQNLGKNGVGLRLGRHSNAQGFIAR